MKSRDSEYWYTATDITVLLQDMRSRGSENYRIMDPIINDDLHTTQTINRAILEIHNGEAEVTAIPFNIGNNHWAGLVLRRGEDGSLGATYNDPLGNPMPEMLQRVLNNHGIAGPNIRDLQVRQQYNGYDCGPWTVFNLDDIANNREVFRPSRQANSQQHDIAQQRQRLETNTTPESQMRGYATQDFKSATEMLKAQSEEVRLLSEEAKKQVHHITQEFFGDKSILKDFALGVEQTEELSNNDDNLKRLNIIAKLFSKVPYTAVLENSEDRTRQYLSLPQERTMEQGDIDSLVSGLRTVVENPNDISRKVALFKQMAKTGNMMLQKLMREDKNPAVQEIAKQIAKQAGKKNPNYTVISDALDSAEFKTFVERSFDKIFSNTELGVLESRDFNNIKITTIPSAHEPTVHVEMRGMSHLLEQKITKVDVGLANPANEPPKCCGGCTAERKAIDGKVAMNVTAISRNNFAPGTYTPSSAVEAPYRFNRFLNALKDPLEEKRDILKSNPGIKQYGNSTLKFEEKSAKLDSFLAEAKKLAEIQASITKAQICYKEILDSNPLLKLATDIKAERAKAKTKSQYTLSSHPRPKLKRSHSWP